MRNTALLLTQYERFGTVGTDEYIENYINEELEVTADMIGAYNEYLLENGYEPYYSDLDIMLCGMTPTEAARCTFYGNFRFAADYHKFNGYANIDSFDDYQVIKEMENDHDFLKWYIEGNDLIDLEDEKVILVIAEANKLIAMGY